MTRVTQADVVIVGSGPTGAAYARVLSEIAPALRVVCLEVGGEISSPPGDHVKNIADPTARAAAQLASEGPIVAEEHLGSHHELDDGVRRARPGTFLVHDGYRFDGEDGLPAAAMSSNVGGMGAHWTCACPRPGGSERIDFVPGMDELLNEAERILGVTSNAFDDAPLSGTVRTRLAGLLDDLGCTPDRGVQPMPLAVERHEDGSVTWSGSAVVFGDVTRTNPNFTLLPRSLALRVMRNDDRVAGVRVRDLDSGEDYDIGARFVVAACDALRTPQLLFASGITPPALGRYLNDQPQIVVGVRLEVAAEDRAAPAQQTPADAPAVAKQSGVSWVPFDDQRHPFHGQVMQLDASPVPLADDTTIEPGSIVGLGWFCAKDIQADDRVEFDADAVDPYGMPAMRIHYRLTARDHQTIAEAGRAAMSIALGLGTPLEPDPIVMPAGSSLHYQGTTRMGLEDDGESVCGPNSEVWGVRGLYVAGNNVIPTSTACNPTLTAVALAVRGARSIAAEALAETVR